MTKLEIFAQVLENPTSINSAFSLPEWFEIQAPGILLFSVGYSHQSCDHIEFVGYIMDQNPNAHLGPFSRLFSS